MTIKGLCNDIAGYLSREYENDTIDDLENLIEDILNYTGIDSIKQIRAYQKAKCDFWNDKNEDGNYFCDLSSEWADGQVDIYNKDLYENAWDFSEWIEQGLDEFGYNKDRGLIGVLQGGQYMYYGGISGAVLNWLSENKI